MAADTATPTRAEQVDLYVHYSAVETFVQALDYIDEGLAFLYSTLHGEKGEVNLGSPRMADELWPGDEELMNSPESLIADSRSEALVARLFAALATDDGRDFCAQQAARFAKLAGRHPDAS